MFKWLFKRQQRRKYTFQHAFGPCVVIYARSETQAWKKMRTFLRERMVGKFAVVYYPQVVERELARCKLIADEIEVTTGD